MDVCSSQLSATANLLVPPRQISISTYYELDFMLSAKDTKMNNKNYLCLQGAHNLGGNTNRYTMIDNFSHSLQEVNLW